jgi:hypothetical protein
MTLSPLPVSLPLNRSPLQGDGPRFMSVRDGVVLFAIFVACRWNLSVLRSCLALSRRSCLFRTRLVADQHDGNRQSMSAGKATSSTAGIACRNSMFGISRWIPRWAVEGPHVWPFVHRWPRGTFHMEPPRGTTKPTSSPCRRCHQTHQQPLPRCLLLKS